MKHFVAAVVVYSMLVMLTVSCSDKGNPAGSSTTDLVGKWVVSKEALHMKVTGPSIDFTVDSTRNCSGSNDYYEFKNDNTYSHTYDESIMDVISGYLKKAGAKTGSVTTETGTWSLSGNTLTVIYVEASSDPDTAVMTVSVNGSNATFTQTMTNEYIPIIDLTLSGTIVQSASKQ